MFSDTNFVKKHVTQYLDTQRFLEFPYEHLKDSLKRNFQTFVNGS